jgi:hypothetical protein
MSEWSEIPIQAHRTPDGRTINVRYFRPADEGPARPIQRKQRELSKIAYDLGVETEELVDYNARKLAEYRFDLEKIDELLAPA